MKLMIFRWVIDIIYLTQWLIHSLFDHAQNDPIYIALLPPNKKYLKAYTCFTIFCNSFIKYAVTCLSPPSPWIGSMMAPATGRPLAAYSAILSRTCNRKWTFMAPCNNVFDTCWTKMYLKECRVITLQCQIHSAEIRYQNLYAILDTTLLSFLQIFHEWPI